MLDQAQVVGRLDMARLVTMACVIAYAASLLLDPRAALRPRGPFDILAPSGGALYALTRPHSAVPHDKESPREAGPANVPVVFASMTLSPQIAAQRCISR